MPHFFVVADVQGGASEPAFRPAPDDRLDGRQ